MDWKADRCLIYVDDALLVISKPTGLLSLPDGYNPDLPHLRSVFEPHFGRLWIVHRLDKETSGVIVLARSKTAHRALNDAFAGRTTTKMYHALVVGEPAWQERTVNLPLLPNGDRRHRTVVHIGRGKLSITHFDVLERFGHHALIRAVPETGRRHQIRAHLAAVGLPVAVDMLYGKHANSAIRHLHRLNLHRLGLHARSIQIAHPITQETMQFDAPYPEDFDSALRQCRVD
jgi:RluA family pseudouridine synthase